jgi:hypothetical protein
MYKRIYVIIYVPSVCYNFLHFLLFSKKLVSLTMQTFASVSL